jgi:hypothetical protein
MARPGTPLPLLVHTLLLAALLAAPAAAPAAAEPPAGRPGPVALVACAPGFPGTREEAQPAMDALAAALARAAAWPEGALAATYLPAEAEGVARLGQPDAAVALVSLPFFLRHGEALGLVPRLQAEPAGQGLTERWSLVAKRGRVARPADLAGLTVLSTAGYAPTFVRGALGAWGRVPDGAAVAPTAQVLSALRKAARGEPVAVLLDGAQAEALASLPFAADLEVVARSAPVPTSLVAVVGARLPGARWAALEKAFLSMTGDPQGAAALAGVRLARFAPVDAAALAAAKALAGAR